MAIERFPDPDQTDENGIIAVGGDLHPDSLLNAYKEGIFPWPMPGLPLLWFCPKERAVLKFEDFHISKSLEKWLKKTSLKVTFNQAFDEVIHACASIPRSADSISWITDEMIAAYTHFHRLGYAHSVEVWDENKKLVGGLYGVSVDGVFSGESMFRSTPNASKLAIVKLIEHLKTRRLTWMDIQVMTPHMHAFGAKTITQNEFLRLLKKTQNPSLKLF